MQLFHTESEMTSLEDGTESNSAGGSPGPDAGPDDERRPTTTTWLTVCETCKRDEWRAGEETTSGEALAALVEACVPADGSVSVRRHACLMGCSRACNVAVQAQGKMAYTLGGLEPTEEVARGLLDWAALHAASDSGVVAYRSWPAAVKGHFVTRHPPLPEG